MLQVPIIVPLLPFMMLLYVKDKFVRQAAATEHANWEKRQPIN